MLARSLASLGRTEQAREEIARIAETDVLDAVRELRRPAFDQLGSEPMIQRLIRRGERKRRRLRQQVRKLDLDLYPPGAEPDGR